MRKLLGIVLLPFVLSPPALLAQPAQRGVEVRMRNERGQTELVKLYDGSYSLVIGAINYKHWQKLIGVRDDIPAVRSVLEQHGFKVEELVDPTGDNLLPRINQFINDYGLHANNRLVIYFSGHGYTEVAEDGRKFGYIVPVDAPAPLKDLIGFQQKALTMDEIETAARRIRSKHALFVFDSCFSGSLVNKSSVAVPPVIDYYAAHPVRQFITAGTDQQTVPEQSYFQVMFVRGLKGQADANNDGYVTGTELAVYLQERVTHYHGSLQTPQYGKIRDPRLDIGDFIFTLPEPSPEELTAAAGGVAPAPALAARASAAMLRGDFDEAVRLANQSLNLDNSVALAYAVRGRSLGMREQIAVARDGSIEAALKDLETANRLEPRNAVFRSWMGSVYFSLGRVEQTKAAAEEAIMLSASPKTDIEFYAAGLAYSLKDNPDQAIINYSKAIQLNPRLVDAYFGRGLAYRRKHNTDLELADYSTAIQLNPRYVYPYQLRAVIYSTTGQYDQAIDDYNKVIQLNPQLLMPYLLRAFVYRDKGSYEQAIASCDEAVRLKPHDPAPYNFRGVVYNSKGSYDRAIADFDKAIQLSPRFANAYLNRGDAYSRRGDYVRAIADYSETIRLDPKYSSAYRARASAYEKVGATAKAQADREKAAEWEGQGFKY